jgi:hypothetical protein
LRAAGVRLTGHRSVKLGVEWQWQVVNDDSERVRSDHSLPPEKTNKHTKAMFSSKKFSRFLVTSNVWTH